MSQTESERLGKEMAYRMEAKVQAMEIERLKKQLQKKQQKKKEMMEAAEKEIVRKLEAKIEDLETKLRTDGKNIVEHTIEQQQVLQKKKEEIEAQKRREREIMELIEEKVESEIGVREIFSSLKQEVDVKKRRLKKLVIKYQSFGQKMKELAERNNNERRKLEEVHMRIMKDMKLKYLIVDNFIPQNEKEKLLDEIMYDEETENWYFKHDKSGQHSSTQRPISNPKFRRPLSGFSRMAADVGPAFRYRFENILELDLIRLSPSTKEYRPPTVSPKIHAVLNSAIDGDEDVVIDASQIDPLGIPIKRRPKTAGGRGLNDNGNRRPKTGSKRVQQDSETQLENGNPPVLRPDTASQFPRSRGLISRK